MNSPDKALFQRHTAHIAYPIVIATNLTIRDNLIEYKRLFLSNHVPAEEEKRNIEDEEHKPQSATTNRELFVNLATNNTIPNSHILDTNAKKQCIT